MDYEVIENEEIRWSKVSEGFHPRIRMEFEERVTKFRK